MVRCRGTELRIVSTSLTMGGRLSASRAEVSNRTSRMPLSILLKVTGIWQEKWPSLDIRGTYHGWFEAVSENQTKQCKIVMLFVWIQWCTLWNASILYVDFVTSWSQGSKVDLQFLKCSKTMRDGVLLVFRHFSESIKDRNRRISCISQWHAVNVILRLPSTVGFEYWVPAELAWTSCGNNLAVGSSFE